MQTTYLLAEKGGSRILHQLRDTDRLELRVASETWNKAIHFSEASGLAQIAKLKTIRPFDQPEWKFELVEKSAFELAAVSGQPRWFRIKEVKQS